MLILSNYFLNFAKEYIQIDYAKADFSIANVSAIVRDGSDPPLQRKLYLFG